jgi:hypothetical protein
MRASLYCAPSCPRKPLMCMHLAHFHLGISPHNTKSAAYKSLIQGRHRWLVDSFSPGCLNKRESHRIITSTQQFSFIPRFRNNNQRELCCIYSLINAEGLLVLVEEQRPTPSENRLSRIFFPPRLQHRRAWRMFCAFVERSTPRSFHAGPQGPRR